MKRINYVLFATLFLMTGVILCSCSVAERVLDASGDLSRQDYVNEYSDSPDNFDLGFNLLVLYFYDAKHTTNNNLTSFNFKAPGAEGYTSVLNVPYGIQDEVMLPDSKEHNQNLRAEQSKDFLNHIQFAWGPELILKRSKDGDQNISLFYFEVPAYALYHKELNKGSLYGGFGPYFAYGLTGSIKDPGDKFNAFDKELGFKRFDAGLGFTAGYKFSNAIGLRLSYELGLANINHGGIERAKNRTIGVHFLYPLDKLVASFKK